MLLPIMVVFVEYYKIYSVPVIIRSFKIKDRSLESVLYIQELSAELITPSTRTSYNNKKNENNHDKRKPFSMSIFFRHVLHLLLLA
jgi:hypothetical protein